MKRDALKRIELLADERFNASTTPMPDYDTFEHDVLIIGAGGAGLRAAIEASAAGVRVGLVCKSLLGKAHTGMAEGGIPAALANLDEPDNWNGHFPEPIARGQTSHQCP